MKAMFFSVAAMAPILVLAQTLTTAVITAVTADATTDATLNTSITHVVTPTVISSTTISATYANPTCGAGYVVDHCLALTSVSQQDCALEDYACQCTTYQAIDTCFDNCPGDPRQHTYAGMIAQYCALAGLPTTNTALAPATSASATSTRPRAKATSTSDEAASSPSVDNGASLAKGAGGVLAIVAGVVVAVL